MQRQLLIQSNYIFLVNLLKSHDRGAFWDTGYEGYGIRGIRRVRDTGYRTSFQGYGIRGLRVTEQQFSWLRDTGYGLPNDYFHGYGLRVTGYRKDITKIYMQILESAWQTADVLEIARNSF